MVKHLLNFVPPHYIYVEPFGGAAWLLFAKPPSPVEVYNDIDSGLVNFYRVLRDPEKFKEFYRLVSLTPYSREEFYYCMSTWKECENDVEKHIGGSLQRVWLLVELYNQVDLDTRFVNPVAVWQGLLADG